ncbi:metal ABC transporter solute-binding protein, Zn/Mn family [Devriesea agamarum]|uniref:metal ABC transporter solute-binding protein, Zn/Mn family n=1 Tax=Devriesea agamarum TaxID=472569 RepID=UPI00071D941B|nr:zinc ABC transporter substrate-binding protein [Devriesea agamarum]
MALAVASLVPLGLAACSSGANPSASSSSAKSSSQSTVKIFASTNVWGSVAKSVGGKYATVVSGVNDPSQDPHDFEPSAKQKAEVNDSQIIIVNGGGYDDWASKLAQSAGKTTIVDAVKASNLKSGDAKDFNEHVFFDVDAATKVAQAVEHDLEKAVPEHAADFKNNERAFENQLGELRDTNSKFANAHPGMTAVATEPVVGYLLEDMGIKDLTPAEFVEQSETEAGASAQAVNDTQKLLENGSAKILVLNAQTADRTTTTLEKVAQDKHIPIVKVYETFPHGVSDYVSFYKNTQKAIEDAAK